MIDKNRDMPASMRATKAGQDPSYSFGKNQKPVANANKQYGQPKASARIRSNNRPQVE
jgi:hypothetical protein